MLVHRVQPNSDTVLYYSWSMLVHWLQPNSDTVLYYSWSMLVHRLQPNSDTVLYCTQWITKLAMELCRDKNLVKRLCINIQICSSPKFRYWRLKMEWNLSKSNTHRIIFRIRKVKFSKIPDSGITFDIKFIQ
jgi:hypothetical protein